MTNTKTSFKQQLKDLCKTAIYNYTFWKLKRRSDELHRLTNSQHFIVKIKGEVSIISKAWFKDARQRGIFPLQFTAAHMKEQAYYYSVNGYGKHSLKLFATPAQNNNQ